MIVRFDDDVLFFEMKEGGNVVGCPSLCGCELC